MTAFGIPPRTAAIVAAVLLALGIVGAIVGALPSTVAEWLLIVALVPVAAINWRRARQTGSDELDDGPQSDR